MKNEIRSDSAVYTLVEVEQSKRDADWESQFLAALPDARFTLQSESAQMGPDGWPYMFVKTDVAGATSCIDLVNWLSTRGIGLAINANKNTADFVLTFGMIVNFVLRNQFVTDEQTQTINQVEFAPGESVHAGPPSEEYIPSATRAVLKNFLTQNGIKNPKVLVMSKNRKNYDLCFSLDSLGHPPEHEHAGILEALSWFLPSHYSLVILPEKGLPVFHAL